MEKFRLIDFKNFSTLLTGNFLALLIASVGGLFIAKAYGPDSFGLYATIVAGAAALTPFLTLGFEQTLLQMVDEKDVEVLSSRVILRTVILGSAGALGALSINTIAGEYFPAKVMHSISLSFLLAMVFGVFAIGVQLNLRRKRFVKLARRGVIQNLILVSTQGLANPVLSNFSGLLLGEFFGRVCGIVFIYPREYIRNFWSNVKASRKRNDLRLSINGWNLISTVLDNLTSAFLVLSFALLFSPVSAATISLSQKIILLPVSVIGTVFGQLIFANGSFQIRQGDKIDRDVLKTTFVRISCLGSLATVVTYLLVPTLVNLMGSVWNDSLGYARILCFTILLQLLWSSFGSLYYAVGKWKQFAFLKFTNILLLLILVLLCWALRFETQVFLLCYVVISALIQIFGLYSIKQFLLKK
jgi:O-antigen/teichoic acid export membrane protein